MPGNFVHPSLLTRRPATGWRWSNGPGFILSGSLLIGDTPAAVRRIAVAIPRCVSDAADALDPDAAIARCLDFLISNQNAGPLVYSTAVACRK